MRLTESILKELNRQDIMSDQNVIDIINSFSSRKNSLNYKIEGNQAVFEDGTIIKFILNDDDELEYYFINSQGDASKTALVYDWSLLDMLTESAENKISEEDIDKLVNLYLNDAEIKDMIEDEFNRWTLIRTDLDYIGDSEFSHLDFLTKYSLSDNQKNELAASVDEEISKRIKNLNESVDTSSLAKFIKDSVETLQTTDYTNCKYNLDEDLAVFVGWSEGYDETPEDYEIAHKETPTWRINVAIKARNEAMWTDLDYLTTPYYVHDGEVYQCQFTVSKQEDYTYLADSLLKAYGEIKELLASGELSID